ncbi:phage tail tip fiber protein [Sphingobium baderi]|uniref:Tip attachment protein J central straight fiber domain-containing protein n=1 Tax=Sphingobium baderi LL03 TaxID=1114964 RepID=T0FZR8_9SPHN|nr:DUF1983 domain-containing protein [Sphingobium baderi]EQA96860.1 hypothetical protein L485_22530 [Sphingobium baderi LL03]KMS64092.1 hypothetical protein V475_20270 [Sphingobium baderi LL03]
MSKVLRTAAMVVGAVALVATGIGAAAGAGILGAGATGAAGTVAGISVGTISAVGTYGALAAGALSMAAGATAPGYSAEGNPTTFTTNPQSGLPYAIGRTRMSGLRIYAKTYDGFKIQSKDDILAFVALLSIAGPIHSIEKFTADNEVVTFDASGNASGRFHDYMGQKLSLGPSSGPALALSFGGKTFPGWTANHKLSGIAHAQWALRFDTDGELYGAGAPEPAWVGKWVKAYDPRKDSTHPGGSGSHRALDESTYEWTDNPGLHALTWALGRWSNGKRVCGIGAPVSTIRVADFVECANVCEANGWKVGGVEWTTDSKWDTLKRMLQAGGAVPTQTGAMIGCLVSTPRTAIATIESRHLHDGLSIAASKSRRDRFNSVIPRYVDEDSDWAVVPGKVVSEPAYVTADKGQRTKEIDFPLVQVFSGDEATQPGQLAAYAIVNSREAGPFTWTTGPEWIGLKTGDVIYLNVPEEGLSNQPVLITRRSPDPSTGKVSFAGETETYSKHAYALGQSTTPPPPFSLSAPDLKPAAPVETAWSVSGTTSGEGFPALIVTGESELPSADAIVIDYRLSGTGDWKNSAIVSAVEPVSHVIAPLESETAYDVRIGYRVGTIVGNFTIFSNVTTGLGKITEIEGSISDIDADLAQLDADTAQALIDIAAAQATITSMQSDAAAMQAALTTAQGQITAQGAAILANANDIATVQSTVASQGAAITTLQQTATDLTGSIATLTTTITASMQGSDNLLTNTDLATGSAGYASASGSGIDAITFSWDSGSALKPGGENCLLINQASATAAGWAEYRQTIAVEVGKRYELSVWAAAARCTVSVTQAFFDSAGAVIGSTGSTTYTPAGGGLSLDNYSRIFRVSGDAPAGAVTMRISLRKNATNSGSDSWARFLRPQVVETFAGAPSPRAFSHGTGKASIVQNATAISTLDGQYAALSTTVGVQGASITGLQSASSTQAGQIATIQTGLSTANANISTNSSAITGLNSSVASINSTLAAQGASITTMQSAITTLEGSTATLTTQVRSGGNANLIPNPGPTNGTTGWTNISASTLGVGTASGGIGAYFRLSTSTLTRMWASFTGIPVGSNVPLCLAASCALTGTGATEYRLVIICRNSSGADVGRINGPITPAHSYDYSGAKRLETACIGQSASGTASVDVFMEVWGNGSSMNFDFQRVKLERSAYTTPYSDEAAVSQSFETLSTLTTQYASLSSTVSTQGVTITSQQTAITTLNNNVTTLFGRWGVEIDVNGYVSGVTMNNNGSRSNFIIRADRFAITSSAGAGTAYPFEVISGVTYIKTAVIKDLSVDTIKIAGNAVTKPYFAATASDLSLSSGVLTTILTLSVTKTISDSVVNVTANIRLYSPDDIRGTAYLYEGTTQLDSIQVYINGAGRVLYIPLSFSFVDNRTTTGSKSYSLRFAVVDTPSYTEVVTAMSGSNLSIVEMKR